MVVSPLDLLELREAAELARKQHAEFSIAAEDIKNLGENRVRLISLCNPLTGALT